MRIRRRGKCSGAARDGEGNTGERGNKERVGERSGERSGGGAGQGGEKRAQLAEETTYGRFDDGGETASRELAAVDGVELEEGRVRRVKR